MRRSGLVTGWTLLLVAAARAGAQGPDSTRAGAAPPPAPVADIGVRFRLPAEPLRLEVPAPLLPFGRLSRDRRTAAFIADRSAAELIGRARALADATWARGVVASVSSAPPPPVVAQADTAAPVGPRNLVQSAADLFGDYADLGLQLQSRLEIKMARNKNDRCTSSQIFSIGSSCQGSFQPTFDFQFNVRSGGVVADRVHINVDYDSQRQFDASNNINVYYEGKSDEMIQRLEVGNVSFSPPASRFITGGIPSGNYGLQAIGQLGPMRFRAITAQQKGNIVKDRVFTVGDKTLQTVDRDIDDYQVEPRRFFFTIDPRLLAGYPNLDILDGQRLASLAAQLPDTLRPTRVYLYRLLIGGQPPNPNGPRFLARGAKNPNRGPVYEYLREGVDYYLDPSNLWFSLVRPLGLNSERLVIAYRVRIAGQDTIYPNTGGTPDLEYDPNSNQVANLIWDPEVAPGDTAFVHEMRSVYRIGGEDIRRETVQMKVVAGAGGDQEKPIAGAAQSYLEMFGLSQRNNAAAFDVDNRLWPRPSDPNVNRDVGAASSKLIRDYFLVFPSLKPFARAGLANPPPNPSNDTIYSFPGEYLYSPQHPQALYRIRAHYQAEGGGDVGSLSLGSVQIRRLSERILVDGAPLKRDVDYTVDYEIGRVSFTRADTLFPRPRQVAVQYEENPLFGAAPTSIFGIASQFPMTNGQINFTAISQSQKTTFNRPPLGFEPASSLVAGVSGNFAFEASTLTRLIDRLPFVSTTQPSTIDVAAEFATSRPQPNAAGQAYVESFEGEGGLSISLGDPAWYYSSTPVAGTRLPAILGGLQLDTSRATTLAWQNNGIDVNGQAVLFHIEDIDSLTSFAGNGISSPEQILWLTLYPQWAGGILNNYTNIFQWQPGGTQPPGRRWRSIRTPLGASGTDLSRVENLEFWALVNVEPAKRSRNPTLVFDFGDISENSLAFAPTALRLTPSSDPSRPLQRVDSLFTGRKTQGFDQLNTERNAFSRTFNVATDDKGLPGDRVDSLLVQDETGPTIRDTVVTDFAVCRRGDRLLQLLGDTKPDCTVENARLDEEDLDLDNVLSLPSAQQANEKVLRYIVDLSNPANFNRLGKVYIAVDSITLPGGQRIEVRDTVRWVHVRLPFRSPSDSIGNPLIRRIKALRLTMVSGAGLADSAFSRIPIARLSLIGSPWLKRAEQVVAGIGGESNAPGGGTVIASIIGTQDRDSTSGLIYESPPGVSDQPDSKTTGFQSGRVQINERSLRLTATNMARYQRAEAFIRFAEGNKSFMGYKEMRVWARGRNNGWGETGELQFFVKIGRDAENFYLYRTPVNAGSGTAAWLPEVRVDFDKIFALRAQVQNAYLQRLRKNSCTGVDSALVARSVIRAGAVDTTVYAACADGYMVFTTDPNVTPPNLAAVQELSVGIVRVDSATNALPGNIQPGDTLEVWVDDIRLTNVVDTPGYAGQVSLTINAGDLADFRASASRRDPNFRQLAEQPSFITEDAYDLGTNVHLDKFLPLSWGLSLPFSASFSRSGANPYFVSRSDIRGAGIEGLRTPQSTASSYSLSARRVTPLRNSAWGPLVNYLSASTAYSVGDNRSEYQEGTNTSFTMSLDYNLASEARIRGMPSWMSSGVDHLPAWLGNTVALRSLRTARLRWNPTVFRLSSAIARAASRTEAFTKLAASPTDTAKIVRGLTSMWRNASGLELRPFSALTFRWDITSLRDLRQYGDTTPTTAVATGERDRFLGVDVGLERQRSMLTAFSFQPIVSNWIRPSFGLGTSFDLSRDPNAPQLLRTGDSTGAFRLPRRVGNTQSLSAGAVFDIGRMLLLYTGDSSFLRRFVGVFQPVDLSLSRSLSSSFDGIPFNPSVFYQLGLGNTNAFRSQNGRTASSTVMIRTMQISNAVALPFGTSVSNRYQHTLTQSYARRLNNSQALVQGDNTVFPSLSARWSYRPALLRRVVSSIGTTASYENREGTNFTPPDASGGAAELATSRNRSYPVSGSISWAFAGGFSTSGGVTTSRRDDARPGSHNTGRNREVSFDVGKAIKVPKTWNLKSDVRTRLSFAQSHGQSFAFNTASPSQQSRLSDNGNQRVTLNADTDVADNLTFSFVGSRTVSFDNNFDRHFTQTTVTAVLHLQFFAGQLR